ncbi:MAG: SIS domain-containing protein [Proteobacteria bacterium]|nr:SIS domain-containing protein [Pseudomonadota bacterium]
MKSDNIKNKARVRAEHFLQSAHAFQLGDLPTEQRHPLTYELADLSRHNITAALDILKEIDLGVVAKVAAEANALARLERAIAQTLQAGQRVFLYGCGATGRLSLSIEHIWRRLHHDHPAAGTVRGFMSGGDLALVHSIENFEDHPEFGARQLREIGFGPRDLLICSTEGGETPSVIGATEEAARRSSRPPFFLYCNPDHVLHEQVERSRRVLENPAIEKIGLFVGPMALSGSTRLQASTALMLGVGISLLKSAARGAPAPQLAELVSIMKEIDFSFLKPFIEEESRIYAEGGYVLYETDDYGITILTDTTERAPTFSVQGFENQNDPARIPALSYLRLPKTKGAQEAWKAILLREPVPLEWEELKSIAGRDRLFGFDFSTQALHQREKLIAPAQMHRFRIERHDRQLYFELGSCRHHIDLHGLPPLFEHVLLKMILNMHSTLLMGRYGRFESNVMTWVKPSNKKLIDRTIRYVEYLLHHHNILGFSYQDICYQLFEEMERMSSTQSVVLMTVESLKQRRGT